MPKRERDSSSESFSGSDDDDDDDEGSANVVSSDEDEDDVRGGARQTVTNRLKKVKTAFPIDQRRSLDWALERVGEAEALLEAAQLACGSLAQPAALLCTLHDYQLEGMRWAIALERAGLSGILADESAWRQTRAPFQASRPAPL
jgi:SNF2 family DNA or RNA helicase